MYKLLISILTFAFTSLMTVMGGPTTCNNPLLSTFGFTPLSAPQRVNNLVYCKSLINSQSCCSETVINNFQVQANELTSRLTRIVIARDQFLMTMRMKVMNQLQSSLSRLRAASEKAMRVIKANSDPSSSNGNSTNSTGNSTNPPNPPNNSTNSTKPANSTNSTNSTQGGNNHSQNGTNSTNSTRPANSTNSTNSTTGGGKRFLAANGTNSTNQTNGTQNGTQPGGNNSTQNGTNSTKPGNSTNSTNPNNNNSTNSTQPGGNNGTQNGTNSTKPANSTNSTQPGGNNSTQNGTNSTKPANSTNSTQPGGNNGTQNGTNSTKPGNSTNSTNPNNNNNSTNSTKPGNSTNSTTTNPATGSGNKFDKVTIDLVQRFGDLAKTMTTNLPQLKNNLGSYQKARTSCIVELINIQTSAWCLACDPNWGTKGVTGDGSIQLSKSLCSRLTSACYDFVASSDEQNSILTANYISPMFDALSAAMEKIARGDPSGPSALSLAYNSGSESPTTPTSNAQLPASKPDACTAQKCDFICSSFLVKGKIDEDTLAAGGELASSSSSSSSSSGGKRVLEEVVSEGKAVEAMLKKRRLQGDDGWNPGSDESGVAVAFEDDPGQVNKSSANLIYNAIVCISALLVALLI